MVAAVSESVVNIFVIAAAAVTVAASVGLWYRKSLDRNRSTWLTNRRITGWRDDSGNWNRGVCDLVMGFDDDQGHHEGLNTRVPDIDARLKRLEGSAK